MPTHADINHANEAHSPAADTGVVQQHSSAPQFEDNRPEAIQMRKLQKLANNHSKKHSSQFIDNRPETVAQRVLREAADNRFPVVQLQGFKGLAKGAVNKLVTQLVAWDNQDAIARGDLTRQKVQQIYTKLTQNSADLAPGRQNANAVEGNQQGFNDATLDRLRAQGDTMEGTGHDYTEWWWARVMLKDPNIMGAVKTTRVKADEVPDAGDGLAANRNARARNAIYYHATEVGLVDTLMANGLTTSEYRRRKTGQQQAGGLAANAGLNAELYQEESKFSVYVTGRYSEAQQYKGVIDGRDGETGVIIFPIVTNVEEDFEVDADSTGLKTAPSVNSSSNYRALGTEDNLNAAGLKLMERAVGPATEDDPRTPLQVYQSQLP